MVGSIKSRENMADCLKAVLIGNQDKTAEVREASNRLAVALVEVRVGVGGQQGWWRCVCVWGGGAVREASPWQQC